MKKILLLVEDEVITAVTEKIQLERYGYTVQTTNSGEEAVSIAMSSKDLDLILMDINLGDGLDGTEAAKLILKDQDIPIVFVSSHTERDIVEKTENITSYGYVVKNSGITVLDASIKMAFKLFDSKQSVQNSEIRYRRLFEAAQDGILILDAETGMIVDVNPFLIKLLGYSKEEFLDRAIWDIGVFKDIVASKESFLELQQKEYVRYEDLPLETVNRCSIEVEFISNVYLVGTQKVIQCNIRENAESKQVKNILQKLTFATQAEGVGIWDYDVTNNVLVWDEQMYNLYGIAADQFSGAYEAWHAGLHPDDAIRCDTEIQMTIIGEKDFDTEFRVVWPDGSIHFLRAKAQVQSRDVDGVAIRMIGTNWDITERVFAEQKIKSILAEKDLILKEVHHRIKNNMSTIGSILSLQAENLKDSLAIEILEEAGNRVKSMSVLYDKLYKSTNYSELSVKDYLTSLVDDVMSYSPYSQIVTVEKSIQDFILDVKKLQPVGIIVNELLTNIMKYAFKGRESGLIIISVVNTSGHVVVLVQDDGLGMPESVSFESSTGFGLFLIQSLTQQLDGTIRAERGHGTKVILEFKI